MPERADNRLVRLLGLVSFLDGRGPVALDELAARFGVSPEQIRADIDQLWVSGTPGYFPGDLIDFDADAVDRGVVHLTESRGLTRPLRLGTREAVALVAALRALLDSPTVQADSDRTSLVRSALTKLSAATGEAAALVDVRIDHGGDSAVTQAVTRALAEGRRLRISYVTAADITGERDVDPVRLVTQDGQAYLVGWCHRAWGQRTFRLDRVLDATVLDDPVDETAVAYVASVLAADSDVARSAAAARDALTVAVTFSSPARWLAELIAAENVANRADGSFVVSFKVGDSAWLRSILLATAPHVLAVTPPDIAREVAAAAREALAAYHTGD